MDGLDLALAVFGALVLAFALFSERLRQSPFSEALVALVVGAAIGPAALGLLELTGATRDAVLEHGARLSLAVALVALAMQLRDLGRFREWRGLVVLLAVVMPAMWLTTSLLAGLVLGLSLWAALLLGAIVTPTDPILAASIVTGDLAEERLPPGLRRLLLAESGANDGLAQAFVFLPLAVLTLPTGEAAGHWLGWTIGWEIVGGAALGAALGLGAGRLLEWAHRSDFVEQPYLSAYSLALSLGVLGLAAVVNVAEILAVFVAGVVFVAQLTGEDEQEEERVQEPVSRLLLLPIFGLLGVALPWAAWIDLGWPLLAFAAAVLLLRRLPVVAVTLPLLGGRPLREAVFLGWFGPIGISALLYAQLALRETGLDRVWTAATFVIAFSIVVHGVTAAPATRRYSAPAQHTAA
jgi:sodium/hydrogen antiporter